MPDYTDVTLPAQSGDPPLFTLADTVQATALRARFRSGKLELEVHDRAGVIRLSAPDWRRLVRASARVEVDPAGMPPRAVGRSMPPSACTSRPTPSMPT